MIMPKATVYNISGEKVEELELNSKIFGLKISPELVQQAVVVQQANARQILANTKDRGEVRGGGRKPWRQKGTGRARHGSIRSPLWRGGGITFGPTKNRNFSLKINKKAKKKALLMTLTSKAINQKIILLEKLEIDQAKTKNFFGILQNLRLRERNKEARKQESKKTREGKSDSDKEVKTDKKAKVKSILVVLDKKEEKIQRAARNITQLDTIQADSLNVLDILSHQYLLMPVGAVKVIEKTFVSASVKTTADKK